MDLPVLDGDVKTRVCVIGLGGAGLTCILECLRLGLDVVGLDAQYPGAGASGRNGGFLLAGLPDFYHRACEKLGRERAWLLYRMTLGELALMAEETPECVRLTGSLRIAPDAAELGDCQAQLTAMQADALPVEWYEGAEGKGLLIPTDGVFQPYDRCRSLAKRACSAGARLYRNSEATAIHCGDVATPNGMVRCERVIVAVDGGLEPLLPKLRGGIRSARLQALATAPAPEVHFPRPVYARFGYDYWQQLPDGRMVLGGLRDAGGDVEWTDQAIPTEAIQGQLDALLRHLGVKAAVTHRWAGITTYTNHGLPLFQEVDTGILAMGGYGGTGNVLGPLLGRFAARWAAGETVKLFELMRPMAP